MIRFLDFLSYALQWAYVLVFFLVCHSFLSLRQNMLLRVLAFFVGAPIFVVIVYSNDLVNLLAPLAGFFLYTEMFFSGRFIEKLTAVLVFYPAVIAVNYLTNDIGSRLFFGITDAPSEMELGWIREMLITTPPLQVGGEKRPKGSVTARLKGGCCKHILLAAAKKRLPHFLLSEILLTVPGYISLWHPLLHFLSLPHNILLPKMLYSIYFVAPDACHISLAYSSLLGIP